MRNNTLLFPLIFLVFCCISCLQEENVHPFVLTRASSGIDIYVDPQADDVTKWAASELSVGLEAILGKAFPVKNTTSYTQGASGIYIGALDDRPFSSKSSKYRKTVEAPMPSALAASSTLCSSPSMISVVILI